MIDRAALINAAVAAKENSYSLYSHYRVGAALLTKTGEIFIGCNIENAAYPATVCAERAALFSAVSSGFREFSAIAIAGGKEGGEADMPFPCGTCRQVLGEFCEGGFEIIVARNAEDFEVHTLGELLPHGFSGSNLK